MDGNHTMGLRAALAAAVVLGLGGAMAPGYAKDAIPLPQSAPTSITETAGAVPMIDNADALPTLNTADAADDGTDDAGSWHSVGGGMASWYGNELAGHRTASGERFNPNELTAANRTLPLGSHVRVTYQGRSVIVRINDRGPFAAHRVIDLSRAAAEQIGLRRAGSGRVTLEMADAPADTDSDDSSSS